MKEDVIMTKTEQVAKEIEKILKDNKMQIISNWADPSMRVELVEGIETYLDSDVCEWD